MAQDFTTPVTSPLHVDRTPNVGNSEGDDGRGRLHTKISNKVTEPVPVFVTDASPTSAVPTIFNVACPVAGTEYSQALPANTRRFIIRARKSSKILFAYQPAASEYVTIEMGVSFEDTNLYISQTIYFRNSKADEVIEIVAYT